MRELATQGICASCQTPGPEADRYAARIVGENRYSPLDQMDCCPGRLPAVFAAITA